MVFNGISMKKVNNKFRGNGSSSSAIYSLNYKFDSNSIAGKISGTALDLIKKYNDFAKDAQGNGDYVSAEIFRQYAEHYRKIVTEINERKNQQKQVMSENQSEDNSNVQEQASEELKNQVQEASQPTENAQNSQVQETDEQEVKVENKNDAPVEEKTSESKVVSKKIIRKSFKIIEISHAKSEEPANESSEQPAEEPKDEEVKAEAPKRVYRRRKVAASS